MPDISRTFLANPNSTGDYLLIFAFLIVLATVGVPLVKAWRNRGADDVDDRVRVLVNQQCDNCQKIAELNRKVDAIFDVVARMEGRIDDLFKLMVKGGA